MRGFVDARIRTGGAPVMAATNTWSRHFGITALSFSPAYWPLTLISFVSELDVAQLQPAAMATLHAAAPALALVFTLVSVVCGLAPAEDASVTLWSAVLPNVELPEVLRQAVSPVEDAPISARFAAALSRGAVFPSMSAAFCDAASLICDDDVRVSSYGLDLAAAAPRAESIKTINDFQFDFFLETSLVVGGEMLLAENLHDPVPARAFLPRVVVDALPALTAASLPKLRQSFDVAENTSMAVMMGTAAFLCEAAALPGETKACPATPAAMAQFVASELGSQVEALSTTGAPAQPPARRAPVKIERVTKRSVAEGDHIIICHSIMFPSALYYCHHVTGTKVVQASLRAADDSLIRAVGICHLDTSLWASEHPAFTALNIPRGAEACHWSSANDVVWVPSGTQ